jgi:hypothetical protein
MGECQFFSPSERQTYNQTTTIRYRVGAAEKTMPLDLTGDQVTVTAPDVGDCPAA